MALTAKAKRFFNQLAPRLGDVLSDTRGTTLAVGPTSGTPNTNLTTAHGLGFTPAGANVETGNIYIVSFDGTNVVVASTAASQSGTVRLIGSATDNYTGPKKSVI